MSRTTETPETKPPALPRRKRSQVSQRSERSDHSGNRSTPSVQEITWRTVDLTPSSGSQLDEGPVTPANSRQAGSRSSSAEAERLLNLCLNEGQLSSNLNQLSMDPKLDSIITKPKIRAFFTDWFEDFDGICGQSYEAWTLFLERYCSSDYVYIRPSGNPMDRKGFAKLLSVDTTVMEMKLVSIDSITIMRDQKSAIVLYTTDQVFTYKGILNEDRAVITCILEMRGNEIKVIHEHRTTGRPIPKETRWASIG